MGTVPLVNQMNAKSMIAITGVALHITNRGVNRDFTEGKNPLNSPKNVEMENMIRKLKPPRMRVTEIFSTKEGCLIIFRNEESVSFGEGSNTGILRTFAPIYQANRSNEVEKTTMSLFFQIEIFIRYR